MNTSLPTRAPVTERVAILISEPEKRALFEAAAERGLTASQLARIAIAEATKGRLEPRAA